MLHGDGSTETGLGRCRCRAGTKQRVVPRTGAAYPLIHIPPSLQGYGRAGSSLTLLLLQDPIPAVPSPLSPSGRVHGRVGRDTACSTHPKVGAAKGSWLGQSTVRQQDRDIGGEAEHAISPNAIRMNLIQKTWAGGFNKTKGPCQESHFL